MQNISKQQIYSENNLLDSSLNHSVLAGFVAGTGHVTLEDQRRLDFIKLLKKALILPEHMRAVTQSSVLNIRASHRDHEAVFYLIVPAADAELPAETVAGGTIVRAAAVLKHTHHTSIKPAVNTHSEFIFL